jgi:hypothetical protein
MAISSDDNAFASQPLSTVRSSTSVDGLVLLDTASGLILSANPVGARIWRLIEQGAGDAEIATHVAADYAIGIERARQDVAAFVDALLAHGLVTRERRS